MTSPRAPQSSSPRPLRAAVALAALLAACPATLAATQDPLAVAPSKVYATTSMSVGPNLTAVFTEFFTGEKNEKTAMNLLLGVYLTEEGKRRLVASRDYNIAAGGYVSRGSLELVDLDRDGIKEILVTYHHNEKPETIRIEMDVLRLVGDKLVLLWNGPVRLNTSAPSAGVGPSERDQFVREIDYARTTSARGQKIYFNKTVAVAAGAVLDPPRVLNEEIPLTAK
jgi:hypothetical protein